VDKTVGTIMKRPISLTVVAVLLFLMGLSGIVVDCVRIHGLAIIPSVNLFNMIAGVGLLKLWRGARWYSNVLLGWSYVVMLPLTVWLLSNPEKIVIHFPSILIDDRSHAIEPLMLAAPIMIGYIILSGWMLFVLNRRDVRELFQRKTHSPTVSVSV
jgi:hypothetical protein